MAKFLTTTGISYRLEEIIKTAEERLVLISPFLRVNERIKELLEDKDRLKMDVRVIYGKNQLQPEENNWLESMASIRTSYCKNLHAKCYLNENEALLTSMNLYEFSQVNNNEMGILISREEEPGLYGEVWKEAQRIVRVSDEIRVTVARVGAAEADGERGQRRAPTWLGDSPEWVLHQVQSLDSAQSGSAVLQTLLQKLESIQERGVRGRLLPSMRRRAQDDHVQACVSGLLPQVQFCP